MSYAADGPLDPPWVKEADCLCESECDDGCPDEDCECPHHGGDEYEFDERD